MRREKRPPPEVGEREEEELDTCSIDVETGEFRLRADQLFLTYPKCDLEKEEVQRQLKEIFEHYAGSVICREHHADGTLHIHCYVRLSQKLDTRNQNVADLTQSGGPGFHGNYQGVKSPKAVAFYVIECGDYIVDNVDIATLPGSVIESRWARVPVFHIVDESGIRRWGGSLRWGMIVDPVSDEARCEAIVRDGVYIAPSSPFPCPNPPARPSLL